MATSRIIATGSYFPPKIVENIELESFFGLSSGSVAKKTGILRRHVCNGETGKDLVLGALADMGIPAVHKPKLVIICRDIPQLDSKNSHISSAVRKLMPNTDIVEGFYHCAGPLKAMRLADQLLASGIYESAVVVAYSTASQTRNKTSLDSMLWGDGAGAAMLSRSTKGLAYYNRVQLMGRDFYRVCTNDDGEFLALDNTGVFNFLMENLPALLKTAASRARKDVDCYICHQPCGKTLGKVMAYSQIPEEKVIMTSQHYGNMIGASFFVTLDKAMKQGFMDPGKMQILSTFGIGRTQHSLEANVCVHYS